MLQLTVQGTDIKAVSIIFSLSFYGKGYRHIHYPNNFLYLSLYLPFSLYICFSLSKYFCPSLTISLSLSEANVLKMRALEHLQSRHIFEIYTNTFNYILTGQTVITAQNTRKPLARRGIGILLVIDYTTCYRSQMRYSYFNEFQRWQSCKKQTNLRAFQLRLG